MTKRIFEFECPEGHRSEFLESYETKKIGCPSCSHFAYRVISAPRIALDGVSMHFPTAADAWANKHEEAARVARKRNA